MEEPVPSISPQVSPRKKVQIGALPEVDRPARESSNPSTNRFSRASDASSVSSQDRPARRSRSSNHSLSVDSTEVPSHESQMNLAALVELRKAFETADADGTGALDEEEFVNAFKKIKAFSKGMDEQQMTHLFMKIDANSDGTVDWVEFTDYILLQQLALSDEAEGGDRTYVKQRIPIHNPKDVDEHARRDSSPGNNFLARGGFALAATMSPLIQKIGYIPNPQQYVTASQDGLIKLWSPHTLQPSRTINNGPAWITDMQVSNGMRMVAALGMDRSVSFYSTARHSLDKVARIENLETVPMTALWIPGAADRERLIYGDDKGALHEFQLGEEWGSKPGAPPFVAERTLPGVTSSAPWKVHQSWVTRMKYISHSASLLTCSMDGYLDMLDFEKREIKWAAKEHQKGVHACDFCRSFNFIVTCGVERHILLWSPYSARPIATLHGHSAPVMDVIVNESEAQILSLGADKVVKVWDFRSNRCIQNLSDSSVNSPTITALFQNPETRSLVAGGMALQQWNQKKAKEVLPSQVCTALYNPNFRQLVVAEADGAISVWNVDNGERVFTFNDPLNKASKISAAAFDHTGRRLIVGGQDGSVRVWNFNSGACLQTFVGFGDSEVTCVASINETKSNFVAAAGWNAQVCVWEDAETEKVTDFRRFCGHTEDISCMAEAVPGSLATGGHDGKVIIWKMDGSIRATLKREDRETDAIKRTSVLAICPLPSQAQTLAVASTDGKVAIWRVADAAMVYLLDTGHFGTMGPMATTLDNKTLFTSDTTGALKSWDLSSGSFRRQTNLDGSTRRTSRRQVTVGPMLIKEKFCFQAEEGEIVGLAFMDTGQMLMTASVTGSSRIWTSEGAPVGRFGQEKAWNLKENSTWLAPEPTYLNTNELAEVEEEKARPRSRLSLGRGFTMKRLGSLLRAGSSASAEEKEREEVPGMCPVDDDEILWTIEEQVTQFLDTHRRKTGTSTGLQKLMSANLQVKELAPVDRSKQSSWKTSPIRTSHK